MTVAVLPPIAPISPGASPITATTRLPSIDGTDHAERAASAANFGSALTGALEQLETSQKTTDSLARAAATGDVQSIEDLMVAQTETQLTTQLTVATRNRAVESFNEIMRMQL